MENKQNAGTAQQSANPENSQSSEPESRPKTATNNQDGDQSVKKAATDAIGQVKEKASSILDEQKTTLTTGLSGVADSLRQVGETLREAEDQNKITLATARYGESLADKIEDISGYLEQATLKDLTRDAERFARQQPALFVGGAFLIGILAARFLKTSAPAKRSYRRSSGK